MADEFTAEDFGGGTAVADEFTPEDFEERQAAPEEFTAEDFQPEQAGPVAPPPLTSDQQQAIGTIKQKVLPIVGDIYGALTGPATQEASELGRKRLGLESGIQKAAQASQKEQTAANLYGAGETAARSLDFLGAAGRVLTAAGEKAEDVVKDVEDWKPTEGDFTMPRTIGGQNIVRPPPGAVESGVLGMARTAPVIAGAMGLQATGVPMPLAFGALSAAETAGQGAGPGEIVQSGLTGAAIPESGAIGKGAAVKLLNTAVDRGLLSADRTLVQKGVEALASQTGMQLFMGGMSLPDYMALPPDQRKQKLKENIIQNAAWLAMEVPGLLPGRPSETQARMSPTTVAASALNRMVNDPKLISAIDENIRQWVPSPKYGITPPQVRTATETTPPVAAEKPTGATLKTGTQPLSGTQEPIYNAEDWAKVPGHQPAHSGRAGPDEEGPADRRARNAQGEIRPCIASPGDSFPTGLDPGPAHQRRPGDSRAEGRFTRRHLRSSRKACRLGTQGFPTRARFPLERQIPKPSSGCGPDW